MRQGSTWHRWTRNCSWVPCLAPLRSQEVCHIGPHHKSHKTPCRSCPPNRTCRSRQSAHPYSSVGFALRHPWEGTIHQHTAIWADHRRRTARPVRDCTAIASLVAPCHSGEIQVRTARDCNHHQSCDPQSHGRDIDLMGAEDGPTGSSNNAARPSRRAGKTGSEIAPPARKIGVMTGSGKATGVAPPKTSSNTARGGQQSRRAQTMSHGARAVIRCGMKGMQAVRLFPGKPSLRWSQIQRPLHQAPHALVPCAWESPGTKRQRLW